MRPRQIGLVAGMAAWSSSSGPIDHQRLTATRGTLVIHKPHRRIVQLGARFCPVETLEVQRRRSLFRHRMADDRSWRRQHLFAIVAGDLRQSGLDHPWPRRRNLSRRLRLVDRLHRLHLAAGARAHIEGLDLCLRESSRSGVSRLAHPPRTRRRFILTGSAIVVLSVILVTSAKIKEKTWGQELPAVETSGD